MLVIAVVWWAVVVYAAEAVTVPGWDQIANLGPTGLLAVGFWLVATGRLVPGTLADKAEARAAAATTAAEKANQTAIDVTAALTRLTAEHDDERQAHDAEVAALRAEIRSLPLHPPPRSR